MIFRDSATRCAAVALILCASGVTGEEPPKAPAPPTVAPAPAAPAPVAPAPPPAAPAPAAPPAAPPAKPAPKSNGPDQKEVDAAIDRGCKWLLEKASKGPGKMDGFEGQNNDAFVLYTLIKGKADPNHPAFQQLLERCLNTKIERTYWAATLAMALETLDPETYQGFIKRCGQYLVDTQCENGQWSYGKEIPLWTVTYSKPTKKRAPVDTGGGGGASGSVGGGGSGGTAALKRQPITPRMHAKGVGDNSNTQYAVLGLRACSASGIEIPKAILEKTKHWWVKDQQEDGGWKYWLQTSEHSYPSMTEGGAGSLIVLDNMLGEPWADDKAVQRGLAWIDKNKLGENVIGRHGEKNGFLYYHFYAVERVGSFAHREVFNGVEWYPEGAKYLLKKQDKDGSWEGKVGENDFADRTHDTCFAILFLRRASRMIFSEAAAKPRR